MTIGTIYDPNLYRPYYPQPNLEQSAHTFILLDRTGSMADRWEETIRALNGYVKEIAITPEGRASRVTLAVFDSNHGQMAFDILRDDVPVSAWRDLTTYEAAPRGMTPLYDALGKIIALAEVKSPNRAVVVVLTDGDENASRELNRITAKSALDRAHGRGWQIVFLGADFDAFGSAANVGVAKNTTLNMSAGNYGAATRGLAAQTTSYFAGGASMDFSDEDRDEAVGKKQASK